jgi:predicted dienelactone hydrolase
VGYTLLYFEKTSVTTGEPRRIQTAVWYPAVRGTGEPRPYGSVDAEALERRSPLIVFSHGYPGVSEISSFLTTALASWGFVVAGPLHPGGSRAPLTPTCSMRCEPRRTRPS